MNCIRCQAPLRRQMETEVGMPVAACVACRSLWFEKDEIRLALSVKSLGKYTQDDGIGFDCPSCTGTELFKHTIENVEEAIISCTKCLGAWVDGGEFAKIKQAIKNAGAAKNLNNPLYSESVAVNIPVNNVKPQPKQDRDWVMIIAYCIFSIGILGIGFVLLKHFGILDLNI